MRSQSGILIPATIHAPACASLRVARGGKAMIPGSGCLRTSARSSWSLARAFQTCAWPTKPGARSTRKAAMPSSCATHSLGIPTPRANRDTADGGTGSWDPEGRWIPPSTSWYVPTSSAGARELRAPPRSLPTVGRGVHASLKSLCVTWWRPRPNSWTYLVSRTGH